MNFKDLVKNAGEQVKSCAAFSVGEIRNICETIGPRPCGEDGEKKAQEHLVDVLKNFADSVTRETFDVHPEAFMAFVPIAGTCLLGATAANFGRLITGKKAFTAASYGLIGTALAGVVGEFALYKKPLDPLFKKKESGNVIAVRKAEEETKRRVIVSGHTDSAPEWTYTYKLGSKGVVTVAGYAVAGLLYDLVASGLMAKVSASAAKKLALAQLAFLPANIALYFFTNNKRYVDGASDDLSGSMVASSVLKFLSDNNIRFKNTEVIALLTGGEEAGLRGAEAFFEAHPEIGKDGVETAFFGADKVRGDD
ncbi:MAG: M28 family peptidase, partial [Clostridia bacterium]|nr:M28 family peptidase [Clostridia bacterium]